MPEDPAAYQSYLLRLWRVRETRDVWRVSLEDPHTRKVRGFASLEEAFRFLQGQTTTVVNSDGDCGEQVLTPQQK